jgi:hypothetical protein
MKCSSLKHSGSETKILGLDDIRAHISPMMQSPRRLLTGQAPKSPQVLELANWPHKLATIVAILRHLCTQLNSQARLEQLNLSKTDPSTWP